MQEGCNRAGACICSSILDSGDHALGNVSFNYNGPIPTLVWLDDRDNVSEWAFLGFLGEEKRRSRASDK